MQNDEVFGVVDHRPRVAVGADPPQKCGKQWSRESVTPAEDKRDIRDEGGDDPGEWLEIVALHEIATSENHRSGAISDSGGVSGGDGSGLGKDGSELLHLFNTDTCEDVLVAGEGGRSFFTFNAYGNDLSLEASGVDGAFRALLGAESVQVLLFAGDFVFLGEHLGGLAHHHLRHRAEESVAIHAIDEFLMSEAIAPARAVKVVGQP